MTDTFSDNDAVKALLVGVQSLDISEALARTLLKELNALADSLGVEVLEEEFVKIRKIDAAFGMGSGKAKEISELAESLGAECIIFDQELSPTQQRNWERLSGLSCLDRQELILQIFSMRAQTREARLQIELAELKHLLPRLAHKYIDLNRQRGGHYGTKGEGEKRLELDRRGVQRRIDKLSRELKVVKATRETQRKKREKVPIPRCALVGYTNAGKSSLLNAMSSADAFVEDKLFATLDTTTRRMELTDGSPILISDTVGFIRRLPHELVSAFRSTLEEAVSADLLLLVLDASDPEVLSQYQTSEEVLEDLGARDKERIIILNKIDLVPEKDILEGLRFRFKDAIETSCRSGHGLEALARRIEETLKRELTTLRFPLDRFDLVSYVHRTGTGVEERYREDAIFMQARLDNRARGQLKDWVVAEWD